MNYGKRSTSKKQKSMHSKSAKAGKKASVIFIKAFLVCLLAAGADRFLPFSMAGILLFLLLFRKPCSRPAARKEETCQPPRS